MESTLAELEERLTDCVEREPSEGTHFIRVVGEFSTGKSRFLAEMLSQRVPESLLPTSDLARETKVPLEIAACKSTELELIRRPTDLTTDFDTVARFEKFPARSELEEAGVDLAQCRLRLSVHAPELVWEHMVESESRGPQKVYLVDTEGWNAEPDEVELFDNAVSESPPAFIYVSTQSKLESRQSRKLLDEFLEELSWFFPPKNQMTVFPVVTHWSGSEVAEQRLADFLEYLRASVEDEIGDAFDCTIADPFLVDFGNSETEERLPEIRSRFWSEIGNLEPAQPKGEEFGRFTSVEAAFTDDEELKDALSALVRWARRGDEFLERLGAPPAPFSMDSRTVNKAKLTPLWSQEGSFDGTLEGDLLGDLVPWASESQEAFRLDPTLDSDHPLSPFWSQHVVPFVHDISDFYSRLLEQILALPSKLKEEPDDTLDQWARREIRQEFEAATEAHKRVRVRVPKPVRKSADDNAPVEVVGGLIAATLRAAPMFSLRDAILPGEKRKDGRR